MHSKLVTIAALALATFEVIGLGFPSGISLIVVLIFVGWVGIPHGATDHLTGRRILRPWIGSLWLPVFLGAYLLTGLTVLVGWHITPVVTILCFFIASAWHFGIEEQADDSIGPFRNLRAIACGGLVIWIPCLVQGDAVASVLAVISDSISIESASLVVDIVVSTSPLLAALVFLDCCLEHRKSSTDFDVAPKWLCSRSARYVAFSLLFSVADPVLSFGVYFCSWHSIRSLSELRKQLRCSFGSLVRKLAPLTLVTVALFLSGFVFWSSGLSISEASTRWLFLGLSSIAVPHLLLDVISENTSFQTDSAPPALAGASS